MIGKTNLDQFATGLVGVRSPYGVPRNPFNPRSIPGGSSSGSAVAVAAGLVPLALGTDTAGSGRVPAGLNNIVGLKPSLGLVSTAGVVPACRSLDCVSIFALTTDDAWTALAAIAGCDAADPYSRATARSAGSARRSRGVRLGVPIEGQRMFFGDRAAAEQAYDAALARCAALGAPIVEIDIEPFYEAARLLYEGPWVAERYLAVRSLLDVVARSHASGDARDHRRRRAAERGRYLRGLLRLEELRRVRDRTFRQIDALLLPTAPTVYTVEQVLADPIALNSRLGTYTNFVNLLDLCGTRGAGLDPRRRRAVRRHAARARRARMRLLASLGRALPRRHRAAARRARPAAAAAAGRCRLRRRRTRSRSPWSARI